MRIGSLFSGIGGLELGLERAGVGEVVWQVEIDPFCRAVLAKHWPNVTRFSDVTQPRDYPHVDLICGGFPCQDVSSAGARRGLQGERSSLWYYFARVVAKVRPSVVVVENVASGVRSWLPTVRRHLCELGYRARAYLLSAADVGALHLRRRVFVVAHAHGKGQPPRAVDAKVALPPEAAADAAGHPELAPSGCASRGEQATDQVGESAWRPRGWTAQPSMVRVVHGVPAGLDGARRRSLGNSVMPQCAEAIGRLILGRSTDTPCNGSEGT